MTWATRIAEARQRGEFTVADYNDAIEWSTCACGEQHPRIPRYEYATASHKRGEPKDVKLAHYGTIFARAVERNGFDAAERALALIEQRAAEVLRGLEVKA